jgi:hypothetical protein
MADLLCSRPDHFSWAGTAGSGGDGSGCAGKQAKLLAELERSVQACGAQPDPDLKPLPPASLG